MKVQKPKGGYVMDNNLLRAEDLAELDGKITFKVEDFGDLTDEIKASQRRVEEYIKKNLENE